MKKLKTTMASIWTAIKSRCHTIWTTIKNKCHGKTSGGKAGVSAPATNHKTNPLPTEWRPSRYVPKDERVCPPRPPASNGESHRIEILYELNRPTQVGKKDYIHITEHICGAYGQAFDYAVKMFFDIYNAESTCEPKVNDILETIRIVICRPRDGYVECRLNNVIICTMLIDAGYYVPDKFMTK